MSKLEDLKVGENIIVGEEVVINDFGKDLEGELTDNVKAEEIKAVQLSGEMIEGAEIQATPRGATLDNWYENIIVANLSNQNIPVYEKEASNGAYTTVAGRQIGYIAPGEHYGFKKRTTYLNSREVMINIGGSNVRRGYIAIEYGPWTGQSGYYPFMYNQVRYNSTRSAGDYETIDGVTYAKYILLESQPVYNQSGNYFMTLPAGTHVLSESSTAGDVYLSRMTFARYRLPGSTNWVEFTGEHTWMDVIASGTLPSTKKIA